MTHITPQPKVMDVMDLEFHKTKIDHISCYNVFVFHPRQWTHRHPILLPPRCACGCWTRRTRDEDKHRARWRRGKGGAWSAGCYGVSWPWNANGWWNGAESQYLHSFQMDKQFTTAWVGFFDVFNDGRIKLNHQAYASFMCKDDLQRLRPKVCNVCTLSPWQCWISLSQSITVYLEPPIDGQFFFFGQGISRAGKII